MKARHWLIWIVGIIIVLTFLFNIPSNIWVWIVRHVAVLAGIWKGEVQKYLLLI